MKQLSTAFWFSVGSGLIAGWLGVVFAISDSGEGVEGAIAIAAAGLAFGLVSLAIAKLLSR